jgi:hypothetical protein
MPKSERVATNVRLDPDDLRQLKRLALERGQSLSGLFQEMIRERLARVRPLSDKQWRTDSFFQIGRAARGSGAANVSEQHDRYLYGAKRRAR